MILDEPTNHIDNDLIDWLEKYLLSYKGAILMITHDRYFLDRVVNRIVELDNKKLYKYQSNYSKFQIVLFLLIFAIMTPLGTLVSNNFAAIGEYSHAINAVVIGIFFHIATTILFESGDGHKFNLSKFIAIILGVGVAYFV